MSSEYVKEEAFLALLKSKLGNELLECSLNLGTPEIRVARNRVSDIFKILKLDSEFAFNLFLSVTAVDWMDAQSDRFEVVYHLLSLDQKLRIRVKAWIPESDPTIDSVTSIWAGADFMEREVWDMYGINFKGHPDLRRILMYEEFKGYPLRKDYPVQAKQPRIPLRYPEVRNTAVDMIRPQLVSINPRRGV